MSKPFLPVHVGRVEAFLLRAFLSVATLWSIWDPSRYDRVEDASGIAKWGVDVVWIGQPGAHPWALAAAAVFGLIYVAALWLPTLWTLIGVSGLAFLHLTYWTLANSQGNTFHGSQMTTFVLLLQVAACVIEIARQRRKLSSTERWTNLDGMLLYFSQCAIAAVYVTSALTKLAKTSGLWMFQSHYFAKSVQKVWRQHYYDNPSIGDAFAGVSSWAAWLAENPMLARLMFAPGFILELFAFVMLWNRRWAFWFGGALVLMHVCIGFIMRLYFPEFEVLVTIFCVNVPFLIAALLKRGKAA